MVDGLRPAGEHELGELAAAMREPAQVATRRPMLELELDLLDLEPGADGVDRHPRLDAEAHRDREHRRASPLPTASAGPRGARAASRPQRSRISERAARLARPKPPPSLTLNTAIARSASVAASAAQVADEIRVTEEQRPRLELLLGQRQRLALAAAPEPDHAGAGCLGNGGRAVARAVVRDHDRRVGEACPERLDRLADPLLLVARGDEDGEPVAHPWRRRRGDRRQDAVAWRSP